MILFAKEAADSYTSESGKESTRFLLRLMIRKSNARNYTLIYTHLAMHFSLLLTFHIRDRIEWMDVGWGGSDFVISN